MPSTIFSHTLGTPTKTVGRTSFKVPSSDPCQSQTYGIIKCSPSMSLNFFKYNETNLIVHSRIHLFNRHRWVITNTCFMNKIICCLQGYFHPEYFSPFFTCHILEFTQTHLCSKEVVCNICFHLILNFSLTMRAKGIKIRRGEYFTVNNIHIYIYNKQEAHRLLQSSEYHSP